MFGLSFGELVVVIIVGVVVIGPKELPRVLRTAGQWAGKARRIAADLRVQSGIDEVLREGSLRQDIEEIRKLARGELDAVSRDMRLDGPPRPSPSMLAQSSMPVSDVIVEREREFPRDGADDYGALPDTAIVYDGSFPASKWAKDEVYMIGMDFTESASPPEAAEAAAPSVEPGPSAATTPEA